jgi:hypothetical protein
MTKLVLRFAIASIVCLLLFTTASQAQSTELQSRAAPSAQNGTIRFKLLNGRTGRPVAGTASHVNVWVGRERKEAIVIPTDANGIASLQLTSDTTESNIPVASTHRASVVVANPVVKFDESLRINVPHVLCQPNVGDHSWLRTLDLNASRVLQEGIVLPNTCGKPAARAKPGEVIIFVRPLNWWERLKE